MDPLPWLYGLGEVVLIFPGVSLQDYHPIQFISISSLSAAQFRENQPAIVLKESPVKLCDILKACASIYSEIHNLLRSSVHLDFCFIGFFCIWNIMIDLFRQNPTTRAPFSVLVLCTIRINVSWVGTSEMCSPPAIQGQLNHWAVALWVYIPRHHSLSHVMHWLPINHRHIEIDQSSNNLSKQSRIYPHSLPNKHRSQSWQIKQLFTFVSAYFVIQKHPFIAKYDPKYQRDYRR